MKNAQPSIAKAHLAVLLTNLFFAVNYNFVKYISPALIGPFALNVFRVGSCVVLFWTVWLFGNTRPGIARSDWSRFLACALTGVVLNQILFIKGLTLTSTIHASLLSLITPILVTLFSFWVLKEGFTILKAAGLALGVGGAAFLVLQREAGAHASNYLLGDVLVIVNSVSYGCYFILVKPLMERYPAVHVMRWMFTLGFPFTLAVGWQQTAQVRWPAFEPTHVAALSFVCLAGTFLAYYLNIIGLRRLGPSVTGSYIYTQPVFAGLLSILFFGEALTWQKVLSAVLISAGVYLVNAKAKQD